MRSITDITIGPSASIKEAMEKMTNSRKGVLLVVNNRNYLVGLISDGDIRRGILNQTLLMSPITQIMNTDPVVAHSKEEASGLAGEKSLSLVPILSRERIVLSVLVAEEGTLKFFDNDLVAVEPTHDEKVLVIIPARGGSKRIPRKNLQKVGGYSLVARAIVVAQKAFRDAMIVVSTDDKQVAQEAERLGVPVPWLRPAHLSTDEAKTFDVVAHALDWAVKEAKSKITAVVLLEPTAPLRTAEHLQEAMRIFRESKPDSVVCVCEVPHTFNPDELLKVDEKGLLKPYIADKSLHTRLLRGHQQKVLVQNGIVYVIHPSTIIEGKNLYGSKVMPHFVDWSFFSDIDEPLDLVLAESKLKAMA